MKSSVWKPRFAMNSNSVTHNIISMDNRMSEASAIWPITSGIIPKRHENPCDTVLFIIVPIVTASVELKRIQKLCDYNHTPPVHRGKCIATKIVRAIMNAIM